MSWAEALAGWREHLRTAGRRRSTVVTHLHYVRRFGDAHGWLSPWQVTPAQVGRWVETLDTQEARRKAGTSLRLFYAWGARQGLVEVNPAEAAVPCGRPSAGREGLAVVVEFPEAWVGPVAGFLARQRVAGGSQRTADVYRAHLRALAALQPDPWQVTTSGLVAWLAGRELAPESRKSVRTALRSFYAWAVAEGLTRHDPAAALPAVRIPRAIPRPVTDDALTTALARADDRQRLMILLAAFAGLRIAEIAAAHPRDLAEGLLYVRGKGGRERVVPVHPLLAVELADELGRRRAGGVGTGWRYASAVTVDGYLFPGPRGGHVTPDAVNRAISRVLPAGWTPHKLRHRFATRAYAGTRDLRAVQELLGHTKPETTARYTAVPDQALRAAVLAV